MDISKRLEAVISFVKSETLADIGTDHGYVPIGAYLGGRIKRGIACDVNAGPLEKAKRHIAAYNLSHVIETRLSDGFLAVSAGEVDCAVIAGMGGMLMIDIIKSGGHAVSGLKRLVLQPQLDVPAVRKFVREVGFSITDELMVYEDNIYYNIICCERVGSGTKISDDADCYTEADLQFGKILINKRDKTLIDYINAEIGKLTKIKIELTNASGSAAATDRLNEIEEHERICKEVLQCLNA